MLENNFIENFTVYLSDINNNKLLKFLNECLLHINDSILQKYSHMTMKLLINECIKNHSSFSSIITEYTLKSGIISLLNMKKMNLSD